MSWIRTGGSVVALAWLLVGVGCGLPPQTLITPTVFRDALTTVSQDFPNLEAVQNQIEGDPIPAGAEGVPTDVAECTLIEEIVKGACACLYEGDGQVEIKLSDEACQEFLEVSARGAQQQIAGEGPHGSFAERWFLYLKEYSTGEFVDRSGGRLARPQVSDSGVENDTIVGLTTVTLEAFYDHLFDGLPVYTDRVEKYEGEFQPIDGEPGLYREVFRKVTRTTFLMDEDRIPTAALFRATPRQSVVLDGRRGITADELEAIRFVSNLSGEQSKALSGFILRFFGAVEITFVIGPHFSVGDHETFAKLVETIVEVTARRLTEVAAHRFFLEYTREGSFSADHLFPG